MGWGWGVAGRGGIQARVARGNLTRTRAKEALSCLKEKRCEQVSWAYIAWNGIPKNIHTEVFHPKRIYTHAR